MTNGLKLHDANFQMKNLQDITGEFLLTRIFTEVCLLSGVFVIIIGFSCKHRYREIPAHGFNQLLQAVYLTTSNLCAEIMDSCS